MIVISLKFTSVVNKLYDLINFFSVDPHYNRNNTMSHNSLYVFQNIEHEDIPYVMYLP